MNLENTQREQKNPEAEFHQTIKNWYDHKGSPQEKASLREIIANRILDNYLRSQEEKTGSKPVLKLETMSTITESLKLIERLRGIPTNDPQTLDTEIQAVLIVSGPGLFLDKKKPNDQYGDNTYRWLNRDRILGGLAYARRIAAEKKSIEDGKPVQAHDLTPEDLEKYAPVIFYNGTAEENAELEKVLENWDEDGWDASFAEEHPIVKKFPYPSKLPYPRSKIRISEKPNGNTKEQMLDLKTETAIGGKLEGINNISVAATTLDFVRLGNYIQQVFGEQSKTTETQTKFWAYPIRTRRSSETETDTVPQYLIGELERLAHYLQQGHLADHPHIFQNISNPL